VPLVRGSGCPVAATSCSCALVVGVMNRKERRLAARLGVEWVGMGPGGWVEVCLGGPGCGCGDAAAARDPRAGGAAPAPRTASEPTEESWPFAG